MGSQETRGRVIEAVSYRDRQGLRGHLMGVGSPRPSLVVLLTTVSYSWQHTFSRWDVV